MRHTIKQLNGMIFSLRGLLGLGLGLGLLALDPSLGVLLRSEQQPFRVWIRIEVP